MTTGTSSRDWDAATYNRVSNPQLEWGLEVLDRLNLEGDETVLDAGCGTGRVTAELCKRLPRGHVIGVDVAPSMIERARTALGPRATVIECDLLDLTLDEPVDAVVSSATFHWIADHDRLFERIYAALKPGGRLIADCGGQGNLESFYAVVSSVAQEEPFGSVFTGWKGPWLFAGPKETESRLERAGFTEVDCRLEERHVDPSEPQAFLETVCLRSHLEQLPPDLREPFVERCLASAGSPLTLDYVRLNITARRSG